jgi:hypothetical protein
LFIDVLVDGVDRSEENSIFRDVIAADFICLTVCNTAARWSFSSGSCLGWPFLKNSLHNAVMVIVVGLDARIDYRTIHSDASLRSRKNNIGKVFEADILGFYLDGNMVTIRTRWRLSHEMGPSFIVVL